MVYLFRGVVLVVLLARVFLLLAHASAHPCIFLGCNTKLAKLIINLHIFSQGGLSSSGRTEGIIHFFRNSSSVVDCVCGNGGAVLKVAANGKAKAVHMPHAR